MFLVLERVVFWTISVYQILILIRVLLTWLDTDPYRSTIDHPAIGLLKRVTDPVLLPVGRIIPPISGRYDISPVVVLILLEILRRILSGILISLSS